MITKQDVEQKLSAINLTIPSAAAPAAAYAPWVISGNYLLISGQLPMQDGNIIYTGMVDSEVDSDTAYLSAQLCGLNIIGQINDALRGDFSRLVQIVRLGGFVQCGADFKQHPKVINGASELLQNIFGNQGVHTRAAVGVASLPLNAATEVDAMVEIRNA